MKVGLRVNQSNQSTEGIQTILLRRDRIVSVVYTGPSGYRNFL